MAKVALVLVIGNGSAGKPSEREGRWDNLRWCSLSKGDKSLSKSSVAEVTNDAQRRVS